MEDKDYLELPDINDKKKDREKIYDKVEKILDKNGIEYYVPEENIKKFIDNQISLNGDYELFISVKGNELLPKVCSAINKEIAELGGHVKRGRYSYLVLTCESAVNERYVFSGKDISYNMDKFDSGEINVCFITGFSGSGKTTFAKELQNQYSNATFISLDVVFNNKNRFTMDKLKYMNILYYKFFNSIGKKYYLIFGERPDTNTYGNNLIRDFIYFILDYASKNKNIRFIVEGMQIYYYMKPEELSNYAIYIVRTSVAKSIYRAAKRDGSLKNKLSDLSIWTSYKNLYDDFVKYYNESSIDELELPDKADYATDINELLNITNHSRIFLTSDWHLFANHYDHDSKVINKQKIISWCKSNIKDNDVFIYLGDISYRYANDTDIENAKKIMKSIPGIKVLVLGNHDKMLGDEFYAECGFTLVYDSFEWNEIIFTHRPINMAVYPSRYWNIHGHIHDRVDYYTMEGDHNINVYPSFYDNKPVTLEYILNHKEELVKNHYWNKEMSGFFTEAANTNKPTVYYCDKINSDVITYMTALFSDRLKGRIAIKLHVGEEGNQNALKPNLLKGLVKYTHGTFVDSNVAYKSKRATTEGHKETAEKHGFTKIAYFDVLDADGDMVIQVPYQNQINKALKNLEAKGTEIPVITPGHHLKEVNVGAHLSSYDSMIVYTHFKGHTMAGYGGAVKNIGMGIPSGKVGKIQVHGKSFRRTPDFLERLVEAAAAVEDYFNGHIVYINVLKNISVDCDCDAVAHNPTISDIGVLVSDNLYAIEQASLDLIRNAPHNKDIMERIASRGGIHQLEYMKLLGMDSDGYILKDLNNRRIKLETTVFNETKRSELPDSAFGIPEDRKYPLDTEQHVKSAIKLFGHAEESKKKALAQRIRTAAKKYDLSIPETTQCYKYLNESRLEDMIPAEVKNIIFDLHDVIVGDTVESTVEHGLIVPHRFAHEIADILLDIFDNCDFRNYDIDRVRDNFADNNPYYIAKFADKIFYELLPNMVNKQPYTDELISSIKSRGYNIYYLSNWSKFAFESQEAFFTPLLRKFDGGLMSFQSRYVKPDKEFYLEILNKYNLNPEETLYFDNLAENISVAESVGMHSILFDKHETPKILLNGKYNIPPDVNNTILIDTGIALETININDIDSWIVESFDEIYEDYKSGIPWVYEDFKSAIYDEYCFRMLDEDKVPIESYAFIRGKNNEPVMVGRVIIYPDKTHEWQVQYPLKLNEDGTYSSSVKSINEWAMAACNPIVGISKPFILKISNDNGSIINTKQYALSPDIIADKYLVINENANLEVVDSSKFKDCYIEAYECTLNKLALMNRLNKINTFYKEQKVVDNTIFYTVLAGKPMLTEDQIDFDDRFKKVDFELMKENAITKLSTIISEFNNILINNDSGVWVPVIESSNLEELRINTVLAYKTNRYKDICIREDIDGYYVYCELTKMRSRSVKNITEITDQMMESILKK